MQTVRREPFNTTSSQLTDLLSPREQTYDEWLLCEVTTSCTHSDNGGLNSPKHQLQTPLCPMWKILHLLLVLSRWRDQTITLITSPRSKQHADVHYNTHTQADLAANITNTLKTSINLLTNEENLFTTEVSFMFIRKHFFQDSSWDIHTLMPQNEHSTPTRFLPNMATFTLASRRFEI